jgi:acylphosphatase
MPIAHVIVNGRVQGVFYRQSAQDRAASLGLSGWVRNLPDGTVELQASGSKDKVEQLIEWCKSGPPRAVVYDLNVNWLSDDESELSSNAGFVIR